MGEWDLASMTEIYRHQDLNVSKVHVHGEYNGGNFHFDLALLLLDKPVELADHVGTVCLPKAGDGRTFDGRTCVVTGWGKDKLGKTNN